jgi:6-phosphogluconolactonase
MVIAVQGAPKPPPERVSLTPRALAASREMLILITGAEKREAVAAWQRGVGLPVARVASLAGAKVLIDDAAAGGCIGLDSFPSLA